MVFHHHTSLTTFSGGTLSVFSHFWTALNASKAPKRKTTAPSTFGHADANKVLAETLPSSWE